MTLADKMGKLEQKVENNQHELESGIEVLMIEFWSIHAKFDLLLRTWENQEQEQKEKGPAVEHSPVTHSKFELTYSKPEES